MASGDTLCVFTPFMPRHYDTDGTDTDANNPVLALSLRGIFDGVAD